MPSGTASTLKNSNEPRKLGTLGLEESGTPTTKESQAAAKDAKARTDQVLELWKFPVPCWESKRQPARHANKYERPEKTSAAMSSSQPAPLGCEIIGAGPNTGIKPSREAASA